MEEFSFPFKPYDIQVNLMNEIKECIENGQVGIFESPTGTGKSLSVLCATMTWLEQFERRTEESLQKRAKALVEEDPGEDWMSVHKRKMGLMRDVEAARDELERVRRVRERVERAKAKEQTRKRKTAAASAGTASERHSETDKDDLAPPDMYLSDEEMIVDEEPSEPLKTVKVFYASRTHSQLQQLTEELAKTRFKPRIVSAASRQALCTNESVRKLKVNHLINEKCMELRKNGNGSKKSKIADSEVEVRSASKGGCCYYKSDAIEDLTNTILSGESTKPSQVMARGEQSTACAYFATRRSIPLCQLVLLPYQVLLHSASRAAWGIELEGNVVVLDEAHNVLQTISSLYSADLSQTVISLALSLVRQYLDTYKNHLKAKNLMYMRQLLTVLTSFDRYIRSSTTSGDEVLTIQAFIIKLGLTDVNLFKLVHYIEATDLCKKFHGFHIRSQRSGGEVSRPVVASGIAKLAMKKASATIASTTSGDENIQPTAPPSAPVPSPLFGIKSFLEALNNRCEDGRIVIERKNAKYRFLMLNPADILCDVVKRARACILVGGTMEPADLLVSSLSRGASSSSIRRFSCHHVIDDHQLSVMAVGFTENEKPFTLTYQTRNDPQVMSSLASSLASLVGCIPNGCVAFFPSYDYMYAFLAKMKSLGIYAKLQEKKVVYEEPRGPSSSEMWERFVTSARMPKGALLCAVVGGKLSEGINFSDGLGRGVIMIGLPYPNKSSVELQEKMKYLDSQTAGAGKQLYDSMCMHAVNQAVGRAIRHRNDYAAVFLMDKRFEQPTVRNQLSGWIGSRLTAPRSFAAVLQQTKQFFSTKK